MALAVLAVLMLAEVIHLRGALRDLTDGTNNVRQAAAILGSEPSTWTPERILSARRLNDLGLSEAEAGRTALRSDPSMNLLGRLPYFGDQVAATRDLTDAAVAGAEAVGDQVAIADAFDRARQESAPPGQRLLALMQAAVGPLEHAAAVLAPPLQRLQTDSRRPLAGVIRSRVDQAIATLSPRLELALAARAVGRYMPSALGAGGPRAYLLLFPNPAELRPAGGFAGAVGSVVFSDGTPSGLQVEEGDNIDAAVNRGFPPPPTFARYMPFSHGHLDIGDNLEPDFPAQAATSEGLFTAATGREVDGTIAVDPYAVQALLAVTGPVTVPVYGTFDSHNFFSRLDTIVNVDRGAGSGKGALAPISRAVVAQVLAQPLGSYFKIFSVLQAQATRRHIQLALHDPTLRAAAAAARADGAIVGGVDDYVMVVDANIGATKGDYYIHKAMTLQAEVTSDGTSRHRLVMRYDLPPPVDDVDRALNPFGGGYHDYVRFYLPQTATLRNFSYRQDGRAGTGSLDSLTSVNDKQVVAAFFELPRGHAAELTLDYEVALRGNRSDDLYIQKQAGIPGYPLSVDISYPGGRLMQSLFTDRDHRVGFAW
jgi:hypothetical protein